MWILRLLAILTMITIVGSIVTYALTRNGWYLQFAWRIFRYAIIVALLVFALLILERVAVIPL
jgi:hypothetical protein